MLKFLTGNKNKFKEVRIGLAPFQVEQLDIDLTEIQEIDRYKIIEHKLQEAFKYHRGEFLLEDDSLYLELFDYKFPGPLVKWFNGSIGIKKLSELALKNKKTGVRLNVILALAKSEKDIIYFEAVLKGNITKPKGKAGFGFDPIFKPLGHKKTLAEIKEKGNYTVSARSKALVKLKKYLIQNEKKLNREA